MKPQDRVKIDKLQINRFFQSYYTEWRHIQVLSVQKRLRDKYEFYAEIIEKIKDTDTTVSDSQIAQEISNGLLFEAIQANIQYIEDLFAFINACEKPDTFLRRIVKYNAGAVTNSIKNAKFTRSVILKQFLFPNFWDRATEEERQSDTMKVIEESTQCLTTILVDTVEFYKKYEFFYNQYKHGLTVALRPFGVATDEDVSIDKLGKKDSHSLVAIDSLNFKDAPKNQYGNSGYMLIPAFDEIIGLNMDTLQRENNLLRFLFAPPGTNITMLVEQATRTKRCIQILLHNFLQTINESETWSLRLPASTENPANTENLVYEFPFSVSDLVSPKQ